MKFNKLTFPAIILIGWFSLTAASCEENDNSVSVGSGGEYNNTVISGVDDGSTASTSTDKSSVDDHSVPVSEE